VEFLNIFQKVREEELDTLLIISLNKFFDTCITYFSLEEKHGVDNPRNVMRRGMP
jgi:hypothetical protein